MVEPFSAGVELLVIHAGSIPMPHGYVFRAEGNVLSRLRAGVSVGKDAILAPCLAFAVRHPEAGTILIDTGLHPDARAAFYREFGFPMSLLFRGLRPAPQTFDEQLRSLEIDPAAVRTVVMTHLHFDHTSGMRVLPNARFTIGRAEWGAARSAQGIVRGYVRHHLPAESRVDLLDLERDGTPFGPFPKTHDLLGDGSLRLISTPGHTPGHMSVLLRLTDGRRVLLAGDAAYALRNIQDRVLPTLTADDCASRQSLDRLAAFMADDPEAIVAPSHDPDAWRRLVDTVAVALV